MARFASFTKFLAAGAVAAALTLTIPAQARDRDDNCSARVRSAEQNLRHQIDQHGEHSKQAERARRQLEARRRGCRTDADHDRDRNTKDRDHDHDQDRDRH